MRSPLGYGLVAPQPFRDCRRRHCWAASGCRPVLRRNSSAPSTLLHRTSSYTRTEIADDEIIDRSGVSCTTIARTGFDLGRRLECDEGLIRVEALLNATHASVADTWAIAVKHPGARHIRRFRKVIAIADPGAESPQETRLRLVLLRGGLPRPTTQIRVGWRRIDMGWPEWKVGVEYDGQQHWNDPKQHGGDIRTAGTVPGSRLAHRPRRCRTPRVFAAHR